MSKSLVLVTVDCWRADHAGFLGYKRNTTPFLDSLAKESIVFSNAIVAGAPTYYSFPGIMASRHPLALGRDVIGLAPGENTVATVLHQSGYATAAFLAGNPYLSSLFGYDAGFDVFRDFLDADRGLFAEEESKYPHRDIQSQFNLHLANVCHRLGPIGRAYDELYFHYCQSLTRRARPSLDSLRRFPSADVIVNEAAAWLETIGGQPFFLWLHFMDPHSPYYPKQEALKWMEAEADPSRACYANSYWNREDMSARRLRGHRDKVVALYDAGIRWVDSQLQRLVNVLQSRNLWDDCVLAATADHGEEFLEHGGRYHSPSKLTEELIHVPLLLHGGKVPPSAIFPEPFSLIDLAPTLLDAVNISTPGSFYGKSFWEESGRRDRASRPVIVESVSRCNNPFKPEQRLGPRALVVRETVYKLVIEFASSQEFLLNLHSDPGELHALPVNTEKPVRRRLLEIAEKHVAQSVNLRDIGQRLDTRLRDFRLELGSSFDRMVA